MSLDSNRPVLCLVTDRARLDRADRPDVVQLLELILTAAAAGVDLVQVREPDLSDRTLADLVARAVTETSRTSTRIIVNDRIDVALATGAAGVHLKGNGVPAERVRAHVPPDWLIGRSIHGVDEGVRATASGALDYVFLGTVFETGSKPGSYPVGPSVLRQVAETVSVPVLGIGGITVGRVKVVAQSGAAGIAGIGLFSAKGGTTPQEFRATVDKIRERWWM